MAVVTALGYSWPDPTGEVIFSVSDAVQPSEIDQLLENPIFVNQVAAPAGADFPMEPGWRKVVRVIG